MKEIKPVEGEVEVLEKRVVKRLTFRNYAASIFDAFNIERGGIYTLKMLLTNPGQMVKEYVATGRYRYTPPIRTLIITTAVAFIIISYSTAFESYTQTMTSDPNQQAFYNGMEELSDYFNVLLWIFIPIAAFFTWLFNRKSGYNYTENMVLQTYMLALSNIFSFLFIFDHLINYQIVYLIVMVGSFFYGMYAYRVFFEKRWLPTVIEYIGVYFLATFIYVFVLSVGLVIFMAKTGGLPVSGS